LNRFDSNFAWFAFNFNLRPCTKDHRDGKMGITVRFLGENLTFFETLSPKNAMCVALLFASTAFWLGTGIVRAPAFIYKQISHPSC